MGLGPTVTFGLLGKMAGEAEAPIAGLALMEAISKIERTLVTPVALFTQPVTGVLMILNVGLQHKFFNNYWLWISILLFAGILTLSFGVNNPALEKMIKMAKSGEMTPEFGVLAKRVSKVGPFIGIMFIIIIIMMVWKPGLTI